MSGFEGAQLAVLRLWCLPPHGSLGLVCIGGISLAPIHACLSSGAVGLVAETDRPLKVDEDGWVKAANSCLPCWRLSAAVHGSSSAIRHMVDSFCTCLIPSLGQPWGLWSYCWQTGLAAEAQPCNDCSQGWYGVWRAPMTLAPSATFPCCP